MPLTDTEVMMLLFMREADELYFGRAWRDAATGKP